MTERIAVIRPANAARAIELALEAADQPDLDRAFEECGPYTFVGFLGPDRTAPTLIDEDGKELGPVLPGDSFIGPEAAEALTGGGG